MKQFMHRLTLHEDSLLNSLRVLLVPSHAQARLVKTDRRIRRADIGTSTNIWYTELTRLRNV